VTVPTLFALESQSYVHHLVSTVRGRLAAGADAADVLAATFPPGSVTGAPKVQAMKVIAAHEPPRGPWCGSLFWAGVDGALASSVLIRTATLAKSAGRWRFRFDAGAGIVADSDPAAERAETETKIAALAWAFAGRNP
jgi:para-aminobenzoate synthetase component 1